MKHVNVWSGWRVQNWKDLEGALVTWIGEVNVKSGTASDVIKRPWIIFEKTVGSTAYVAYIQDLNFELVQMQVPASEPSTSQGTSGPWPHKERHHRRASRFYAVTKDGCPPDTSTLRKRKTRHTNNPPVESHVGWIMDIREHRPRTSSVR